MNVISVKIIYFYLGSFLTGWKLRSKFGSGSSRARPVLRTPFSDYVITYGAVLVATRARPKGLELSYKGPMVQMKPILYYSKSKRIFSAGSGDR